ncbi:FtsX-like permease family protein [Fulvivirgaceae bacterium BMA10]|uniref:FtsX-like permease family protein n=1 Tax=Splendidivirga corallicola TaxID=3051826 RepID=A0ABT8KUU2_9BACT|nr:FtsX-like permease family protein [Fulvivirgaceae bacterium BMA10]
MASSIATIEGKWKQLFPDTPFNYNFVDQEFAVHFEADQKLKQLLSTFTMISIVVAILGLFGLSTFLSIEKAREMSIRKVIGATENQIFGLLSWQFIKLILIANTIGIPLGYYLMIRWLSGFAYKIDMPLYIFLLTVFITVLTAMLTMTYHAYKTARTNPVSILSNE